MRKIIIKILRNKFFLKMLFTYYLVIFLGLGFTSYFVTSEMIGILTEKESQFDYEVVQKVKTYSDDKFKTVNSIFARLYMQQYFNNNTSIVDFINPSKSTRANAKYSTIVNYLYDTCTANAFISDFFIIDYHSEEIFFYSNVPSRDVSINYDFYRLDFLGRENVDNTITIIPNYIPEYINLSSVNNFSVISCCLYLFDENSVKFDKPLGMAVVNMRADFFRSAYKDSANFKGTIFVLNKDGLVMFDSSGILSGGLFPFEAYSTGGLSELASNDKYIVNTLRSEETGFFFVDIVDRQLITKETDSIRRNINNIIAVCIVLTLLISLVFASIFTKRIRSLVRNMQDVENGKLDTRIAVGSDDEIGYLEHSFNTMCEKLEEHIENVYVYEIKTKAAELKSLQAQINPHFLFNTLESIRVTAQINKDVQAAKMVHMLGNMFRWSIKMDGMFVDLKEEIDYVRSYIELQRLRHDNAFGVSIDIDPAALRLGVPKLILQPMVENAIIHGLSDRTENGYISVLGKLDDEKLILKVSDNGRGMDANTVREVVNGLSKEESESIGLSNVHQRVSILFGEGIKISSEFGKGTEITILIPALRKEEIEQFVQGNHS